MHEKFINLSTTKHQILSECRAASEVESSSEDEKDEDDDDEKDEKEENVPNKMFEKQGAWRC